jgi:peptidoglycan hydrolase-like protein with peptidoglycan-binding domain
MANYNSNANIVKQVQAAINAAGRSPQLAVDGVYGTGTMLGVKWFQGQHGLTQDGIIGDQTLAATITTPPAGGGSLVALQAQLAQLSGGGAPPSSALIPFPVTALSLPGPAPTPASRPLVGASTTAPFVTVSPTKGAADEQSRAALVLAGLGGAAGAVVGALITFPLGALLGGVLGGAAGFGFSTLQSAPKPAAADVGAAMHGEDGVDFCDDLGDFGCDEPMVVAGEIGTPTCANTLKG